MRRASGLLRIACWAAWYCRDGSRFAQSQHKLSKMRILRPSKNYDLGGEAQRLLEAARVDLDLRGRSSCHSTM